VSKADCFRHSLPWRPHLSTTYRAISNNVGFRNTQKKIPIDKAKVIQFTQDIKDILSVSDFAVDVWFCTEAKIKELNRQHRRVNTSTDVLSFPANDFIEPEVFDDDDPTLEFDKHLGDLVIAPSYVQKQCSRDKELAEKGELGEDSAHDRGVSLQMSTMFDVQDRMPLLLIHGMLHLLGYSIITS